ncbi:MAG: hypothetical protein AAGH76_12820 [Pseudomonadota bacterium]
MAPDRVLHHRFTAQPADFQNRTNAALDVDTFPGVDQKVTVARGFFVTAGEVRAGTVIRLSDFVSQARFNQRPLIGLAAIGQAEQPLNTLIDNRFLLGVLRAE